MLTKNQFSPNSPASSTSFNTALNYLIDGINNHSHDINQATDTVGAGGFISQFGSGDTRYTSVGPGSSSWATLGTLTNKAPIPADPGETAIDPITGNVMTSGTASTYSSISYGHGIGIELARIRGQLAKLTGQKWYTAIGSVVSFNAGGSGIDLTVGTLSATAVDITPSVSTNPPLVVAYSGTSAPPMVNNLNVQYVGGYQALGVPGTASTVLATNAQGLYGQNTVAADTSEGATYNGGLTTTNTIQDNLNNLRYVLQVWARAAWGASAHWYTPAISGAPLVASLSTAGGPGISGPITLNSGDGIQIVQDSSTSFRFNSTGVVPILDSPVLQASDFFQDTVLYGSLSVSTTALTVTVNANLTGYVLGVRQQSGGYPLGPLTVVAGQTNYIWWNGGSTVASFQVTQTSTSPGGGWVLVATGTLQSGATNASQTTTAWTIVTYKPVVNTKPTITGSRGGNAALTSLIAQLASMNFIVDATTA